MTSSKSDYPPKASPPNAITLWVMSQYINLEGDTNMQSIAAPSDPYLLIVMFCVILSPGVWVRSSDLLLIKRTQQKC